MTPIQIVYYTGLVIGICSFTAAWLIRHKELTDGPLGRLEKPMLVGGAAVTFVFAFLGFVLL